MTKDTVVIEFPINNRKSCRNAWLFLHLPANVEIHSVEEIAQVEEKIKAAWKRITGEDWPG